MTLFKLIFFLRLFSFTSSKLYSTKVKWYETDFEKSITCETQMKM